MSGPVEVVLILAAVAYVLVRRMIGEPAQAKRMLVLPAVLAVIGLSDVSGAGHSLVALLFLAATAGVSLLLGALRGMSIRLSSQNGLVFVRYSGVTVALWVVNLVVKFGANLLFGALDPHAASAAGNSLLFTLGLGMLAEGLVVLARALRTDSRIAWAEGKGGAPHTMSPALDEIQRRIAAGRTGGESGSRLGDLFSAGGAAGGGPGTGFRRTPRG
ncbi:DUF1453 domain-containing protein [Streptomyces sp. NPDC056161]|uniref:DUF1453 domain-containing protein n=1 Tax=Streptomyces sp. NPDC056161 TaxID=3345732 RepID=UPI0035D81CBE